MGGGGNAPLGAYLSIASIGRTVGIEGELAYHRDSEDSQYFPRESFTLHTVTAGLGPRFELGSAEARAFVHILAALRHDSAEFESNTAFGGMAGGGIDIPLGSSVFFRLGADFQIFFDEGENLKTLAPLHHGGVNRVACRELWVGQQHVAGALDVGELDREDLVHHREQRLERRRDGVSAAGGGLCRISWSTAASVTSRGTRCRVLAATRPPASTVTFRYSVRNE